jgi:hypothetical protein
MRKTKYYADTEFGRIEVEGKELKTLILYLFDGQLDPRGCNYRTVSKKELCPSNVSYFRKLYRVKNDISDFAYGANEVRLYSLKSVDTEPRV